MTLEQVTAAAAAVFGPDITIGYSEIHPEGWSITTTIREKVDPSAFAGTAAAAAYDTWEYGESVLERWMRENGESGCIALGAAEYNRLHDPSSPVVEAGERQEYEQLQAFIARGGDITESPMDTWADGVMERARARGWSEQELYAPRREPRKPESGPIHS